jgi:hypothetical protein
MGVGWHHRFLLGLVLGTVMGMGSLGYLWVFAPYANLTVSLVMAVYDRCSGAQSQSILLGYAKRLEVRQTLLREPGEPGRGLTMEPELRKLVEQGISQDRQNVILFYIKVLPFTPCCYRFAEYPDKEIIGDVVDLLPTLSDQERLAALKLIEGLRRNHALFKPRIINQANLQDFGAKDIHEIVRLYETWWSLPLPTSAKLKVDPLEKSDYYWSNL